jgi:DNA polymerase I-like protein with 3'-5' exonuclease and polymerase domains
MKFVIRPKVGRLKHMLGELNLTERWVAFDTETTGLDHWGTMGVDRPTWPARAFCVSMCDPDGSTDFERWPVCPFTRRVHHAPSRFLVDTLADPAITKVGFNTNFDIGKLEKLGFTVKGPIVDTLLMAHVLDPDAFDKRLKPLTSRLCGIPDDDQDAVDQSAKSMRHKVRIARNAVKRGKATKEQELLARYAIDEPLIAEWEEKKTSDDNSSMADCFLADENVLEEYARKDALRTAVLYETCLQEFKKRKLAGGRSWEVYQDEQKLAVVVKAMEDKGIRVDKEKNREIVKDYWDIMKVHREAMDDIAPDFNAGSWKQKQEYFFLRNDYKPLRYSESKKKSKGRIKEYPACQWCKKLAKPGCKVCQFTGRSPKCDGEFLESIGVDRSGETPKPKDRLAWHILHHQAAKSMVSFCSAYERFVVKDKDGWILHPNYRQAGPVTNRFAAERPNMQNASTDDSGKKKVDVPYRSREPFIPREGRCFYIPDYSQIEIWMLYICSKDKALGQILLAGGDTHGKVAQTVVPNACDFPQAVKDKNVDPRKLSPGRLANLKSYNKTRKKAKNTQFCKVYGGGVPKIAQTAGCSFEEAKEFVDRYEATFTGVTRFMNENIAKARKYGGVENPYGMWYPIDFDRAYVATNYIIQGGCASMIKRAMVRVYDEVIKKYYEGKMDLLLTIHDELLFDVSLDVDNMETMKRIAWAMQADHKMLGCPVPFPVGMKVAYERWSESKEIKL